MRFKEGLKVRFLDSISDDDLANIGIVEKRIRSYILQKKTLYITQCYRKNLLISCLAKSCSFDIIAPKLMVEITNQSNHPLTNIFCG